MRTAALVTTLLCPSLVEGGQLRLNGGSENMIIFEAAEPHPACKISIAAGTDGCTLQVPPKVDYCCAYTSYTHPAR